MTKLRSRLLVALVLAAVALAAAGIDAASAGPNQKRDQAWRSSRLVTRAGAGSFGEPDPTGSGAPIPVVKPSSMTGVPGHWLAQLWIQWKSRSPFAQQRSRP